MENSRFIEVTDEGGCKFSINIDHIAYIRPTGGGNSNIHLNRIEYILSQRSNEVISVEEGYEEIMSWIGREN